MVGVAIEVGIEPTTGPVAVVMVRCSLSAKRPRASQLPLGLRTDLLFLEERRVSGLRRRDHHRQASRGVRRGQALTPGGATSRRMGRSGLLADNAGESGEEQAARAHAATYSSQVLTT